MTRPVGSPTVRLLAGLVVAVLVAGCGGNAAQSQVEQALASISAWLQVDDDGGDTAEAVRRAERLLEATAPVVDARPDVADLAPAEEAEFHDALAALRSSVARQRDVLVACDLPDPGACLAQSDLDPQELARTVTRFQDALAPLDRPLATAGR